jgi:hypothetical protein
MQSEPKSKVASELEGIISKKYKELHLDEYYADDIAVLKKNRVKSLEQWKDLTSENKDLLCNKTITEFPIPVVLRQILDEATQGNPTSKFIIL